MRARKTCMGLTKGLALIAMASVMDCTTARAEDLCPAAPFETNVDEIAAAMVAEPLKPAAWYAERLISRTLRNEEPLTDGMTSASGGGLMSTSVASLEYDAGRYVLVQLVREGRSPFDSVGIPHRH